MSAAVIPTHTEGDALNVPLRTVRLYGQLGARFGRVHRLAVSTTAEAARALAALVPGFEAFVLESGRRGVGYACFVGANNIAADAIDKPSAHTGGQDIRIAPVLTGAKRGGLFQIVLGAALFFAAPYLAAGAGALGVSVTASTFAGVGLSMMVGGVLQALSPQPRGLAARDGPENSASYHFNGPVNTSAQGGAVPVLYGELFVGSMVISAGLWSQDQAAISQDAAGGTA